MHRSDRPYRSLVPSTSWLAGLLLAAAIAVPAEAFAQPNPLPTGPQGGGEEEPKPKGIAEAAPKPTGLMSTTLTLPPPRDRRKKFEVFTIDGYLRMRGDWLKNLHLGFASDIQDSAGPVPGVRGGAPFPVALSCTQGTTGCSDTIKSSNLRLRLEPTIQLSETVTVHTQIDLLDNLVLGSTPAGTYRDGSSGGGLTPLGAFSGGQTNPEDSSRGLRDSIVVRRAWAEVSTALGFVKFGRMPDHFGLGITANSGRRADTDYATWETLWRSGALANVGGDNPIGYDLDSDHGDTVDRLLISTSVPGTNLEAAAAYDWPASNLSTEDTDAGTHRTGGQGFDLDDSDDADAWMLAISHMDAPRDFDDKVARGKLALNYGARLMKRSQSWDYEKPFVAGTAPADGLVPRALSLYQPDVWFKAGYKKWKLELELTAGIGSLRTTADFEATPVTIGTLVDVRTWGGVVRASTRAFDDKFHWGIELGAASGDEWDNDPQGATNLRHAQLLPPRGDSSTIRRFAFDPDYDIDLILFRELLGAVSNAAYFRPHASYQLTKSIVARGQNVTSAAIEPVATPGNSQLWGTEFDFDISYQANGFTLGGSYGVLFPLGAMDHPADLFNNEDATQIFENNLGDASNAHTIQLRLSVEF